MKKIENAPVIPRYGGGGGCRMRRPLSDCTNTARNSSQSSSSSTPSLVKPKTNCNVFSSSAIVAAAASTSPSPPPTKHSPGQGQFEASEIDTDQAAKDKQNKWKMAIVPVIGYTEKRSQCNWFNHGHDRDGILSTSSAMPKKRKQYSRREHGNSKKALEDYIHQQRSYYAEVDAFDLPEEEVDSIAALE